MVEESKVIQENLLLRCNMMESTDPDLAMKIKEARDEEMLCEHPEKPQAIPSLDLEAVMEKQKKDMEEEESEEYEEEESEGEQHLSDILDSDRELSTEKRGSQMEIQASPESTESFVDSQLYDTPRDEDQLVPKLNLNFEGQGPQPEIEYEEEKCANSEQSTAKLSVPTSVVKEPEAKPLLDMSKLKQQRPKDFQEEFMENFDDFSQSWRDQIIKQNR